jgi:beta-galactosidase
VAVKAIKGENGCVSILLKGKDVRNLECYTVFPDGTLRIEVATAPVEAAEGDQPGTRVEIPRLGFRFHVAEDAFSYFGRGPVENYWDRGSGTSKRIWKASAQEEYYPYVRPQETGHHTETSWLKVGRLTVRAEEPFEFNALRQQVEDLDGGEIKSQTHICDVPVQPYTEVCIDYRMTGVGGYDSWGARPEPERTLWADQSYRYTFTLTPGR